jgi:hypothetical protein
MQQCDNVTSMDILWGESGSCTWHFGLNTLSSLRRPGRFASLKAAKMLKLKIFAENNLLSVLSSAIVQRIHEE